MRSSGNTPSPWPGEVLELSTGASAGGIPTPPDMRVATRGGQSAGICVDSMARVWDPPDCGAAPVLLAVGGRPELKVAP